MCMGKVVKVRNPKQSMRGWSLNDFSYWSRRSGEFAEAQILKSKEIQSILNFMNLLLVFVPN